MWSITACKMTYTPQKWPLRRNGVTQIAPSAVCNYLIYSKMIFFGQNRAENRSYGGGTPRSAEFVIFRKFNSFTVGSSEYQHF